MNKSTRAKSKLSRFSISVWLAMAMFAAVIVCFVVYVQAEKRIDRANDDRHRVFLLAEELRESSDDLTRMVRTYVATSDPTYRRHYQEILDIRDGKSPRPLDYQGGYWYVYGDLDRPRPTGPAVSILDAMRQAGFTDEEFAKLAEAKAKSDALTRTEWAAMALVESGGPDAERNRFKAIAMLHDAAYQQAKTSIMRPIIELHRMADERTRKAVEAAAIEAFHARIWLIVFAALLMLTLWGIRRNLIAVLGGSVSDVFDSIARLGSGDFAGPIPGARDTQGSVLAWLRETQANLARIDAERRQGEEALRQSERRLHDALDNMLEGCMLIGFDWTYLYVNEAAARYVRQPRSQLVGRKAMDVFPELESTPLYVTLRRVMQGRSPERCQASYTFADGNTAWYEFSVVPTPEGIFVLGLDITERRLLAERLAATNAHLEQQIAERTADLQSALDAAEQASHAKSSFLSSMSHELRTPMNAILGFSQLLLMKGLPPQQQSQVKQIRRAGEHLLALIDDLLDLTRIESGQVTVAREPVDLAVTLEEALSIVRPLLGAKKLELANCVPPQSWVLADPVRLRQVVVNLLSNAAKYNREAGQVVIETSSPAQGRLRMSVRDTGLGIPAEEASRLFRTFERLGAAQRGIEGTGIGLALSRQLIELMGGAIGVESQVERGSTFWIELSQAPARIASDKASSLMPLEADGAPFKVLYIEDNSANLMVMEHLFEARSGWQLLQATTGDAGLAIARSDPPDVILLDIHLPGLDGYEVLRALRADPRTRDVPVVALSADAMPSHVQRGLRAGFRDYLPKPLDLRRLVSLLEELASAPSPAD